MTNILHTQQAEMIERAALQDLHDATPQSTRTALGLQTHGIDGALVSVAANDDSILWNRTVGLGIASQVDPNSVEQISKIYRNAGVGRFFLHLYDNANQADLSATLQANGLEQARGWMKFIRTPDNPPDLRTDLEVREIGPERGEDMARIVAAGFDLSPASIPALAALPGRDHWRIFMCFEGETPAGCGSLFIKDGIGWCDWGATDPRFRRRGAQSALLARRIQAAASLKCHTIFTATGEAVPGDPQHSYHNIERAGFTPFKLRENFAPPKAS